jgi:chemotaxis protein methyltransferase CheR
VLIYFDEETRAAALARLSGALEPDGYLILGAAETIDAAHFTPAPDIRGALIRTPAARAAA